MESTEQAFPRARKEGLLIQELTNEVLVYDRNRHKAHCLNHTAALVWDRCDGKTNAGQMARLLVEETNSPVDEAVVYMAFDQLAKARLLHCDAGEWTAQSGISRRDVMKRIGTAAVLALPVVSSIVAPDAVQALTCGSTGFPCTSGIVCCSSICNAGTCT